MTTGAVLLLDVSTQHAELHLDIPGRVYIARLELHLVVSGQREPVLFLDLSTVALAITGRVCTLLLKHRLRVRKRIFGIC